MLTQEDSLTLRLRSLPGDIVCVCGRWVRLNSKVIGPNLCRAGTFWYADLHKWVQCNAYGWYPWRSYTVL